MSSLTSKITTPPLALTTTGGLTVGSGGSAIQLLGTPNKILGYSGGEIQAIDVGHSNNTTVSGSYNSTGSNIILNSSSAVYQIITSSSIGQTITLPDATTISPNFPNFMIMNKGLNDLTVYDYGGNYVCTITSVSACMALVLISNINTAGSWRFGNFSTSGADMTTGLQLPYNVSPISGTTVSSFITYLQNSTQVISLYNLGDVGTAKLSTIAAGTFTPGTATTILALSFAAYFFVGVALTTTKSLVVCCNGNTSTGLAIILNVSGTTITPATSMTYSSGDVSMDLPNLAVLTSTSVMVLYSNVLNSNRIAARVLTVATNTITAQAECVISVYDAINQHAMATVSPTSTIIAYTDTNTAGGTQNCIVRLLTVSGNTITAQTSVIFSTSIINYYAIACVSSSVAILAYTDATDYASMKFYIRLVGISGNALTLYDPIVISQWCACNYPKFTVLSPNRLAMVFDTTTSATTYGITGLMNIPLTLTLRIDGTNLYIDNPPKVIPLWGGYETGVTIMTVSPNQYVISLATNSTTTQYGALTLVTVVN